MLCMQHTYQPTLYSATHTATAGAEASASSSAASPALSGPDLPDAYRVSSFASSSSGGVGGRCGGVGAKSVSASGTSASAAVGGRAGEGRAAQREAVRIESLQVCARLLPRPLSPLLPTKAAPAGGGGGGASISTPSLRTETAASSSATFSSAAASSFRSHDLPPYSKLASPERRGKSSSSGVKKMGSKLKRMVSGNSSKNKSSKNRPTTTILGVDVTGGSGEVEVTVDEGYGARFVDAVSTPQQQQMATSFEEDGDKLWIFDEEARTVRPKSASGSTPSESEEREEYSFDSVLGPDVSSAAKLFDRSVVGSVVERCVRDGVDGLVLVRATTLGPPPPRAGDRPANGLADSVIKDAVRLIRETSSASQRRDFELRLSLSECNSGRYMPGVRGQLSASRVLARATLRGWDADAQDASATAGLLVALDDGRSRREGRGHVVLRLDVSSRPAVAENGDKDQGGGNGSNYGGNEGLRGSVFGASHAAQESTLIFATLDPAEESDIEALGDLAETLREIIDNPHPLLQLHDNSLSDSDDESLLTTTSSSSPSPPKQPKSVNGGDSNSRIPPAKSELMRLVQPLLCGGGAGGNDSCGNGRTAAVHGGACNVAVICALPSSAKTISGISEERDRGVAALRFGQKWKDLGDSLRRTEELRRAAEAAAAATSPTTLSRQDTPSATTLDTGVDVMEAPATPVHGHKRTPVPTPDKGDGSSGAFGPGSFLLPPHLTVGSIGLPSPASSDATPVARSHYPPGYVASYLSLDDDSSNEEDENPHLFRPQRTARGSNDHDDDAADSDCDDDEPLKPPREYESEIRQLKQRLDKAEEMRRRLRAAEEEAARARRENEELRRELARVRAEAKNRVAGAPSLQTIPSMCETDADESKTTSANKSTIPTTATSAAATVSPEGNPERQKLSDAVKYVDLVIRRVVAAAAAAHPEMPTKSFVPPATLSIPSGSGGEQPHAHNDVADSNEPHTVPPARTDNRGSSKVAAGKAEDPSSTANGSSNPTELSFQTAEDSKASGGDAAAGEDEDASWAPAGETREIIDATSIVSGTTGTGTAVSGASFQMSATASSKGSWMPAAKEELIDIASMSTKSKSVAAASSADASSWAPAGVTQELLENASLSTKSRSVATKSVKTAASSTDGSSWMPAGVTEELMDNASVSTRSLASSSRNRTCTDDDMSWAAAGATMDALDNASVSTRSMVSGTDGSWAAAGATRDIMDNASISRSLASGSGAVGTNAADAASTAFAGRVKIDDSGDAHDDDSDQSWHAAGATGNLLDNDDVSLASVSTMGTFQSAISALTDPTALFHQHHHQHRVQGRAGQAGEDAALSASGDPSGSVVWELYRIQGLLRSVLDEKGEATADNSLEVD